MWGRLLIIVLAAGLLLAACAKKKDLVPTGGSRADGTIDLSYEVGLYEKPILDQAQGLALARQRCAAWGYKDAEAFGGEKRQCQQFYGGDCLRWFVTMTYQCLGANRPT